MPSTQPYGPTYDFETDPDPQQKVNAAALQAQLNLIAANIANLITALGTSIRDDNTLTDQLVRIRNLHPELATYLDSRLSGTVLTQGLDFLYPVRAASTANVLNLYDAQTIDGVALVSGDFVLLKDQTAADQNGLWEVHAFGDPAPHAAGLWVRRDDLIAGAPSGAGWAVCVREGAANADTVWAIRAGGLPTEQPVVGTDPLSFFPVFAIYPVPIAKGGTGASTAAGARANLGVPGRHAGTITGDGITQTFVVTHNLGTVDVLVGVRDVNGRAEMVDNRAISTTQVQITFATAPASGETLTVTTIG